MKRRREPELSDLACNSQTSFSQTSATTRKRPLHFLHFNGVVCSNTLFSNNSALTISLLFRANSTCKGSRTPRLVENTSGFRFWGPLARTNVCLALCGLPRKGGGALESALGSRPISGGSEVQRPRPRRRSCISSTGREQRLL